VARRFRRLKEEEQVLPQVFLIDGGLGQISAAAEGLSSAGAAPGVLLALAKQEETLYRWADGRAAAVPLDKASPGLRLLMYVRDEAHRFAQHYHHLLRRKAVMGGDA
jgi:excinuclease ABC subunit C